MQHICIGLLYTDDCSYLCGISLYHVAMSQYSQSFIYCKIFAHFRWTDKMFFSAGIVEAATVFFYFSPIITRVELVLGFSSALCAYLLNPITQN